MKIVSRNPDRGFTLIELLFAVIVAALLAAIAIPTYQGYVTRARNSQAIADIGRIDGMIQRYYTENGAYPPDLATLGPGVPTDPWGRAYEYLNIAAGVPLGMVRKDKNLNPLNSDYDLYSMGPDGDTAKQLTAAKARDDLVRAGNGGFLGLASEH